MKVKYYYMFLLIFWGEICFGQQIEFANIYFISGYYRVHNFLELNDSSYILIADKGTDPWSPRTQYLLHLKANGDTLNSHEFFSGYITDGLVLNDSVIIVMPVVWNNVFAIDLVKINVNTWDSSGSRSYGTQGWSGGIFRATDGGYLLTNGDAGNYSLTKLDTGFNVQWNQPTNFTNYGELLIDSLNNILVTCLVGNGATQPYAYCYYNSSGTLLWARSYGNNIPQFSGTFINGTVITSDSNFLAFTGGADWQLMKINHVTGDTMWTKQFPIEIFCSFTICPNRHFICTGIRMYIIDDNGDTITSRPCPFIFGPAQAHKTKDGGFAVYGYKNYGPPTYVPKLPVFIKTDSLCNTVFTSIFDPENNFQPLTIYPNPATDKLYINAGAMINEKKLVFTLTDMQGRSVLNELYINSPLPGRAVGGEAIDVSTLPNGIYIATLKGKEKEARGKVLIQR